MVASPGAGPGGQGREPDADALQGGEGSVRARRHPLAARRPDRGLPRLRLRRPVVQEAVPQGHQAEGCGREVQRPLLCRGRDALLSRAPEDREADRLQLQRAARADAHPGAWPQPRQGVRCDLCGAGDQVRQRGGWQGAGTQLPAKWKTWVGSEEFLRKRARQDD